MTPTEAKENSHRFLREHNDSASRTLAAKTLAMVHEMMLQIPLARGGEQHGTITVQPGPQNLQRTGVRTFQHGDHRNDGSTEPAERGEGESVAQDGAQKNDMSVEFVTQDGAEENDQSVVLVAHDGAGENQRGEPIKPHNEHVVE